MESKAKAIEGLRTELQVSSEQKSLVLLYPDEMELVLEALEALETVERQKSEACSVEYKQFDVKSGEEWCDWKVFDRGFGSRTEAERAIERFLEEDKGFLRNSYCVYRVVPA